MVVATALPAAVIGAREVGVAAVNPTPPRPHTVALSRQRTTLAVAAAVIGARQDRYFAGKTGPRRVARAETGGFVARPVIAATVGARQLAVVAVEAVPRRLAHAPPRDPAALAVATAGRAKQRCRARQRRRSAVDAAPRWDTVARTGLPVAATVP